MQSLEAIRQEAGKKKEASRLNGIVPVRPKSIAVLTPTLGAVSAWWHTSLQALIWPTNTGRAPLMAQDHVGNEIGEMRNRMVQTILQSAEANGADLDSIFWLDDDVIVSRFCLVSLRAHDRDIAAGVYFTKMDPGGEPLIFAGGGAGCEPWRPGEIFDSWGYAQGLSLVKADVYRRMKEELDLGVDKYGNPAWYAQPEFEVKKNGNVVLGGTEDFKFFANAEKLGICPLVDCTKHTFGFHFDLKGQVGYPRVQWDQFVRREPIIWKANRHHAEVIWE